MASWSDQASVAAAGRRLAAGRSRGGAGADAAEEELVHAPLAGDLRVEAQHEQVALARGDRMAVDGGEHLHRVAVLGDPGRPDEHRAHRWPLDALNPQVRLERADLAPERVAPARPVAEPE